MHTSGELHAPLGDAGATSNAPGKAEQPMNLHALARAYLEQYAGHDRTRVAHLHFWCEHLGGERPFAQVTDDQVFAGLEALRARPARTYIGKDADGRTIYRAKGAMKDSTVNRYHAALMALFTWAIKKRLAPRGWESPAKKIERTPEKNQVVRFLSNEERSRLLAACSASRWPRLYVLVLMAITTGARRSELLGLTWGAIDLERGLAHVAETKNDHPRTLPLVPTVAAELARFRADRPEILVFPGRGARGLFRPRQFESAWRAALKAAGVKRFRFHDLRHTCASYLAQEGASLLEIADVMGHRQLAMVKRYAHLTTDTKAKLVNRVLGAIK